MFAFLLESIIANLSFEICRPEARSSDIRSLSVSTKQIVSLEYGFLNMQEYWTFLYEITHQNGLSNFMVYETNMQGKVMRFKNKLSGPKRSMSSRLKFIIFSEEHKF